MLSVLRKTHSFLGVLIFPLVLVVGFTGFYLNHSNTLFSFIGASDYDESQFDLWPNPQEASVSSVKLLAGSVWPEFPITRIYTEIYHDRPSYFIDKDPGTIIVSRATGHYFVKSGFTRATFAPDGTRLDRKVYWGSVFKWLHTRGWLSDRFGTFLADITSIALMVFAISGAVIWWLPRYKKIRRKLQSWRLRPVGGLQNDQGR